MRSALIVGFVVGWNLAFFVAYAGTHWLGWVA